MFLNQLYGGMDEPEIKIIDVFICKLRKKLANAFGGKGLHRDDLGPWLCVARANRARCRFLLTPGTSFPRGDERPPPRTNRLAGRASCGSPSTGALAVAEESDDGPCRRGSVAFLRPQDMTA